MSSTIDMETAQFSYELALKGIAHVALEAMEDMPDEPPWWRPFLRARWRGTFESLMALSVAAIEHEQEQRKAASR